jgi:hypothetical protein
MLLVLGVQVFGSKSVSTRRRKVKGKPGRQVQLGEGTSSTNDSGPVALRGAKKEAVELLHGLS